MQALLDGSGSAPYRHGRALGYVGRGNSSNPHGFADRVVFDHRLDLCYCDISDNGPSNRTLLGLLKLPTGRGEGPVN
jgi:hypothetical protein